MANIPHLLTLSPSVWRGGIRKEGHGSKFSIQVFVDATDD
jgi:hypothetical protein